MGENWCPIKNFDGFYQISTAGNVRARGAKNGRGDGWHLRSLSFNHDGYLKVRLIKGDKDVTKCVHVLVAEAFIPNPNGYRTVNHKNGDKTDNRVENLEWADRSQQMIHAYKLGLKKPIKGSKNSQAKLTDDDVRYIRSHYKRNVRGCNTVDLGKQFGVSNRVIGLIVRGLSYTDVK